MAQCWVWHINDDHSRLCSGFNIENKPGVPETVFISRCQDYRGQEQRHVPIGMRTWGMGHQNIQKASFQISYDMNQTCSYFWGRRFILGPATWRICVTPMLGFIPVTRTIWRPNWTLILARFCGQVFSFLCACSAAIFWLYLCLM